MQYIIALVLVIGGIWAQKTIQPTCKLPVEPADPVDEFDCGAQKEFPVEEYEKALSKDAKAKEAIAGYGRVDEKAAAVCPDQSLRASVEEPQLLSRTRWIELCPSWSYIMWKWVINIYPYGQCFLLTPINATRCATRSCRYLNPYFYSRCRQLYRRVHIIAYCPRANGFVWTWKQVPSCCRCERLMCGPISIQETLQRKISL